MGHAAPKRTDGRQRRTAPFRLLTSAAVAFCAAAGLLGAQSPAAVALSSAVSPSAAQPDYQTVSLIGTGFPAGTIAPADVVVTLTPAVGSTPAGSSNASAVATVSGTTRRIQFIVPTTIVVSAPTAYRVAVAGRTTTGTTFTSSNTAPLTVLPPA